MKIKSLNNEIIAIQSKTISLINDIFKPGSKGLKEGTRDICMLG